jgi:hypothetical protein
VRELVLRDVLVARRLAPLLALFYVLYLAMAAGEPLALLLTTLLGAGGAALGPLALDARRGSEALWASLPVDRAALVRARYLAAALWALAALLGSWAVGAAAAAVIGRGAGPLPLPAYAALAVALALVVAAYLPFHFKLGPGAGLQVFSTVAALLLLAAAVSAQAAAWLIGEPDALLAAATWRAAGRLAAGAAAPPPDLALGGVLAGAAAVAAALYLLSMRVSEQLYRERDL